ncbi:hypothetical protein G4B88_030019 [Cannabis sativa]|uniref:Uncharacterized protein n=1 Tax=Cannabis sativa TaxID=3483 RepID=A0A7J6DLN3_CANSA|nr:hypothetical protein G4B88_030019 [Cannabis sativa]
MVPQVEPENNKVQKYPTMPEVVEELKKVSNIGFPILTMSLVNYLRNMAMVICMGRLGSLELAGGALAIGFTNIIGYSLLSGLAMGMDPLCSQAIGSQNHALAFLTLQRTIFILLFASLPISLLWFNLQPLICLAVCLEWWWYEFMTLLAGYLPNPKVALATSAIVIQTTSLMYTIPSALSASVSTRVGNELGAERPEKAKLAASVAVSLALITSLVGLVGTTFGRGAWGRVYTHDKEILELTMAVLPIIGVCELANCPQTTSCGILRGCARPGIGAAINFYAFYLVGAPVAVVLGAKFKSDCMTL